MVDSENGRSAALSENFTVWFLKALEHYA